MVCFSLSNLSKISLEVQLTESFVAACIIMQEGLLSIIDGIFSKTLSTLAPGNFLTLTMWLLSLFNLFSIRYSLPFGSNFCYNLNKIQLFEKINKSERSHDAIII